MQNDIVVITKKKSTNDLYSTHLPVEEGFKIRATFVDMKQIRSDLYPILAAQDDNQILLTSPIKKIKVNEKKFIVKLHTQNSIYKLKFKDKEKSEFFKKFL